MPSTEDHLDDFAEAYQAAMAVLASGGTLAEAEKAARRTFCRADDVLGFSDKLAFRWAMDSAIRDLGPQAAGRHSRRAVPSITRG